ncbi:AMP-dependent synthetase/ligase [Kaarinaea lacus]
MHPNTLDIIDLETAGTLPGLFRERVKRSPQSTAYRYFAAHNQRWQDITWQQSAKEVARIQAALANESLYPGDRVAIMACNCPQWVHFEQAALGLGLVVVPLYTNDRTENISYVLQDAGIKVLLIEGVEQLQNLEAIASQIEGLVRLLSLQPCHEYNRFSRLQTLDEWLDKVADDVNETHLQAKENKPEELATIVYTSGTTGRPKGVMLNHRNILSDAHAGLQSIPAYREDVFLSFLPLSHMLERTAGYYIPMFAGAQMAFARSVQDLAEDLVTIRPTVLISVPRIYERVYNKIAAQLEEKPAFARNLFQKAVNVGWDRFEHPDRSHLAWPLLKALVAGKITAKLGGRLRVAICGGAPLSPTVAKTFIGLGIQLLQGYGLTETSPIISVNTERNNDPASVGAPLQGVQVRVSDHDELLVRGPLNMMGYWHNKEATDAIIDQDGWLHTGDKVRIDEQNRIYITGRLKEIIVLSNGEKIPPTDMELAIAMDPLFDHVMVVGEGRPYLGALLVLNPGQWQIFCDSIGEDSNNPALLSDENTHAAVLERVCQQIKDFPGYAQIQRIALILEPWTIENGLITPTLKLKRQRIMEHCAPAITALYTGHSSPSDIRSYADIKQQTA